LGNLNKLEVLNFSCVGISPSYSELPESWKNLTNLKYLNIYGAKLSKWPKWLCQLHNLKVVNTSELKKVPKCIKPIVIENADLKMDALLKFLNNK
jgi:Leucine-rich repeat (LRR) protein